MFDGKNRPDAGAMITSRIHKALVPAVAGLILSISAAVIAHAEALRTGGTGAALATMRQLGAAFARLEPTSGSTSSRDSAAPAGSPP